MNDQKLILTMLTLIGSKTGAFEVETIGAVIRRRFIRTDGETAECVDLFPQWNKTGTYGRMRVAVEYMDHDWQKDRFSTFAGIKYEDLPVYESESCPRRAHGREHSHEIPVQPFRLMIIPQKDDEGNNKKGIIHRYLPPENTQPQRTAPASQPQTAQKSTPIARPPQPAIEDPNQREWKSTTERREAAASPNQQSQPKQLSQEEYDHWFREAVTAQDAFMFDTAVSKMVKNLGSVETAEATRKKMYGADYRPDHAEAYLIGIQELMDAYDNNLNTNLTKIAAYNKAYESANRAFRKAVADLGLTGEYHG